MQLRFAWILGMTAISVGMPAVVLATNGTASSTGTISLPASPGSAPAVGTITVPSPASSPSQSPSASPVVSASPAAVGTSGALTEKEKKTLMSEYNRAQSNEEKALRHVSQSEIRELTAAQTQRNRTWHEQEKRSRRAFFDAHTSGPDRRKYVQDYIQRKKDFDQSQKNEYESTRKNWATKLDQMKVRQKEQRKKFKALIDQGQRPPADLWPSS